MDGKLIVFEGVDGAGTTSVSTLVAELLKRHGVPSLHTSEPGGNSIAYFIRSLLDKDSFKDVRSPDAWTFLFTAARAEHVYRTVFPVLEQGRSVVTDRYILSTIIYQSLQGGDLETILNANSIFPVPDFLFVLDTSPEVAWQRVRKRRVNDRFETFDFIERVAKRYSKALDLALELEREYRFELAERIVMLDSNEEGVEKIALKAVNVVLEGIGSDDHVTLSEAQRVWGEILYDSP